MAYNVNELTKLGALKNLAARITADFATKAALKAVSDRVEEIATVGGEPNVINAVKVGGEALPVTDKAVDIGASISAAVAAADHLQRKKVASVDAIDPAAEGADKFIYMVPKTGSDEDDQYDEYMVLDGAVEHMGNTKVDLSGYVQEEALNGYVQKEAGKGLSANDYTDGEMARLAAIAGAMYQAPTATQFRAITPAYSGTGPITEETVGGLLGDDGLAGLTASGTDGEGNSQYDLAVNGVTVGTYTKNTALSDILEDINGNEEAGVSVSFSGEENKFIFTAKKLGPGGKIEMGSGLAGALFDAAEAVDWSSKKFIEVYDVDWLRDGETVAFTLAIPGDSTNKYGITKETTNGDIVDFLNASPMGMNDSFACNKYTGRIEARNKKSGLLKGFEIFDPWGDAVEARDSGPASPYTYGQEAVFTAVKVNGALQPVSDGAVNISVPVKVSQLDNDSGYIKAEDVAADAEVTEMLAEVFGTAE